MNFCEQNIKHVRLQKGFPLSVYNIDIEEKMKSLGN